MRTKVERSCKKTGQQKVNISLTSPKVVLNAKDCARFLDSMGKTSILLGNKSKAVVASSRTSSPALTSTHTSLTTSLLCSSTSFRNDSSTLMAATQMKICKNVNSVNNNKSADNSDTDNNHVPCTSITDNVPEDNEGSSVQTKMILKPPKKRRGVEKKFETTFAPLIFNSVDVPPVSSVGELEACTVHQDADTSQLIVTSHRDTFQKHSVEQLLQHQPGLSVNAAGSNQTIISRSFSSDSRSQISPLNDLSLALPPHSSSLSLPLTLSPNVDAYKEMAVYATQLYTHPYSITSQPTQNHIYPGHTSSIECSPSLPPSHLVSTNQTLIECGSFLQLPEQIEPMNLSTSCKPATGLISLQVSPTTDRQTADDVSTVFMSKSLAQNVTELSSSTSTSVISETSNTLCENHNSDSIKSNKKPSDIVHDVSLPGGVCSEKHVVNESVENSVHYCVSDREIECRDVVQASTAAEFPLESSSSHKTIFINVPHTDPQSVALYHNMQSPVIEMFSGDNAEMSVCSQVEQSNQTPVITTGVSGSVILNTALKATPFQCSTNIGINEIKNICKESSTVTEVLKKTKKTHKKKVDIPMDEVSFADRNKRYSLTVDDVVANFTYTPEPPEECFLTEEEEAAIRDQFENVSNSENLHKHSDHSHVVNVFDSASSTAQTVAHSGSSKLSADSESPVKPLKKRPAALITDENTAESHQNVQKTVENIDKVLTFVANDFANSSPSNDNVSNANSNTQKMKKSAEQGIRNEKGARKKMKQVIDFKKIDVINNICSVIENTEHINVIISSENNHLEKHSKAYKVEKENSDSITTPEKDSTCTPAEGVSAMAENKLVNTIKRKVADGKLKTPKKRKTESKQLVISEDSVARQTVLVTDKEAVVTSRAETSDIGESIASTSGCSEHDTPVHESEPKDEMTTRDPQMADRENHDTGVESGGDDKPVRRYKKRLDFVKCDQCDHQARGRSALSRHLKKVHMLDVNMPFRCQHCDYGCTKMASLNRHLFTHGVYPCSRCGFVADERIKLTEHLTDQHKDKLDVKMCKVCNRYIKCDKITIEQHTQECQGPTPFQCTECEKEFKYASSLRVHYHTHFPDQPKRFKCEQCDYVTNYKANLHKHHKNMHASRDRDIQCPECGKLFSTEDNMRRHRKVHTLVRPFSCETCEKTFKTSGALRGHQLIHTAARPYPCNITGCNRTFRTPKFLKSHQEEFHRLVPKKYFCSVEGCNYSFFKRSHLKRHAITHTGERNFHCTWPGCSKSFRHADNLKVHFRSHSNEKPIQCLLCDFKCKQKNSLFLHKKRVHQIIDMSMCPRGFERMLKATVTGDVKSMKTHSDVNGAENIQKLSSDCQNASEKIVLGTKSDATKTVVLPPERIAEDQSLVSASEKKFEPPQSTVENEQSGKSQIIMQEEQGPLDLYEFKSDEESGDETPGTFRRDKNVLSVLTPLPPPPKELLRKNEILEMKEKERKEKADKKEQERKEKAERLEHEKKEKLEKKNIEKKAKAEKKEIERKERMRKKEQERKEKVEKKKLELQEKLEKKEIEKKEKIEQKQQEKKEQIEKREREKKEKAEIKEKKMERNEKIDHKLAQKSSVVEETTEDENIIDCEEVVKNSDNGLPISQKRRKSQFLACKEQERDDKICKKGIKKIQDNISNKCQSEMINHRVKKNVKLGTLTRQRNKIAIRNKRESRSSSSVSSVLSAKTISMEVKAAALNRRLILRGNRKGKVSPPKRKPSARIKAKIQAKETIKSTGRVEQPSTPGFTRKSTRKQVVSSFKETKELKEENSDEIGGKINIDSPKKFVDSEVIQTILGETSAPLKSSSDEITTVTARPLSPASSEEIMLQGKASPYRDFSDAEEDLEEQINSPVSSPEQKQAESPDTKERSRIEEDLLQDEKMDNCSMDRHISHPVEEYSDDDDVSNDIPLTPPRAPAPPPMESSEDELEPEPEPTPFSVPGPTTPFSVPGPNTPFSNPPATNLTQQHSVNSEEAPISAVPSIPSMEMHSQCSVDMQQSLESVEMHSRGSVEMNHSLASVEIHHSQNSYEIPHTQNCAEIRSHNPVEIISHGSVEMVHPHGSEEILCHGSITESIPHSEHRVRTPDSVMRDISNSPMSEKYELPQSLQEHTQQASDADKEYFDQYLRSLSAANNRAANGCMEPSLSGLQQLEAMVGKSHLDSKDLSSKSPISCLPTSVITNFENTLPLLSHGDLRARIDALVSDRHHESLYTRDTPSSLSRLPDRQTPLSSMGHSPAFDAFSSLNSLHPSTASSSRENSYLRQTENLFPTPPSSSSFMTEAMFQRQTMTTPFLPHQTNDRSSFSRITDSTPLQPSSSSLLRRSGPVPGSDMFSAPTMPQSMPRHPFANAWTNQEVRSAHWQTPYFSHQPNMTATGTFFPTKDSYLTGREFMFDASIRQSSDIGMFPSLSSAQSQDSYQLDRFDLCNYFPNAMTPYGSSSSSLEYSRSAHVTATKPFDDRYRHSAAATTAIPDFRGLNPGGGSSDMFTGLPRVNTGFNLYTGSPISYHAQHMSDNVNSAFLTHSTSAQHAMFERDYAAAHRSLYPQNTPYPFVDERQYSGASKLAHSHPVGTSTATQERDLISRSAVSESQMQDPYRGLLYRY